VRLIYTFLLALSLSFGAYAATAPDAKQITQELEQAKAAKPAQPETVEVLQSALNALEERKSSLEPVSIRTLSTISPNCFKACVPSSII
jgi:septal ring factor EnvC (AmiA/AmiB activator)